MLRIIGADKEEVNISEVKTVTRKNLPNEIDASAFDSCNNLNEFFRLASQPLSHQDELEAFLQTYSVWSLLDLCRDSLEAKALSEYYFRLPDLVANVCRENCSTYFRRCDFVHRAQAAFSHHVCDIKPDLMALAFSKYEFALLKFQDFGVKALVDSQFDLTMLPLQYLCDVSKVKFVHSLLQFEDSIKCFHLLDRLVNSSVLNSNILKSAAFDAIDSGAFSSEQFAVLLHTSSVYDGVLIQQIIFKLLDSWSNKSWIKRTLPAAQLYLTTVLVVAVSFISKDSLPLYESKIMYGVEQRLSHSDSEIRYMGALLAQKVIDFYSSELQDVNINMELDRNHDMFNYFNGKYRAAQVLYYQSCPVGPCPYASCAAENSPALAQATACSAATSDSCPDILPIAGLMMEGSDARNAKVKKAKFLEDCLKMLRSNEDPKLVEDSISRLHALYLDSSRLSRQLHAVESFKTVLSLSDKFEFANFDACRIQFLSTLVVDQIALVGPALIESIFRSNSLVLNQRMECLQTVSVAFNTIFRIGDGLPTESCSIIPPCRDDFLLHLAIPLVKASLNFYSTLDNSHAMFADKFLTLNLIMLNAVQNQPSYGEFVKNFIPLLCKVSTCKHVKIASIQKSLLMCLSILLECWPSTLSLIDNYHFFERVFVFASSLQDEKDNPNMLPISLVLCNLQRLCNTESLILESNHRTGLDFTIMK